MDKIMAKLTVYFESPFWVGLYERNEKGRYAVCKITFGAEPKDGEIIEFLCLQWKNLVFSPSVQCCLPKEKAKNPKRMQRLVQKEMQKGVSTKAQQALQAQREQNKKMRKTVSKAQKETEKKRKFVLQQEKRKAKHKGH